MGLQSGSTKPFRDKIDRDKLYKGAELILDALEGSKRREGTKRTPERIARDWPELFEGYNYKVEDVLNRTFDAEGCDEMVIVSTDFTSTCEHHILPFRGKAWVGYVPTDRIVGLDKLIKLVWMFSKRLQNQERITTQVANAIKDILDPLGVMVVLKASHDCVSLRGTKSINSITTTSACLGIFRDKPESRKEFLNLIK